MGKTWRITKWDGDTLKGSWDLPAHISNPEMETILQRLVCQSLSEDEIISASLRRNDRGHSVLLERIGTGKPLLFGHLPQYSAEIVDA